MILTRLSDMFRGEGLRARAMRGTVWTFFGFGSAQFLRLLSNLVLTRLLFPEAFGLMALVQVVMIGLNMFSDTGINMSILQNRRGDEPGFLDTAWTVAIGRGVLLWLIVLLIALPVANFYDQPLLAQILPVAGLTAVLGGLQSTKMFTANRQLLLGRLTALELGTQALGIAAMVLLAYWTKSVWALVIGGLIGTAAKTILSHIILPGRTNRLFWDREVFGELFHFGKYIFVSSAAGFLINNGDRAILGKFIAIGDLGVYNIGFFLATVPLVLTHQSGNRILVPLYAKAPPAESAANRVKIRKARTFLSGAMLALALVLGLTGDWLVDILYEPDYAMAGPVLVLLSLSYMPLLVTNAYSALLLAAGNSRDFALLLIVMACLQTLLLFLVVRDYGLIGAIVAPPVATLLVYPLTAWLARRQGGWDAGLDAAFLGVILAGAAVVLWINDTALAELLQGIAGQSAVRAE